MAAVDVQVSRRDWPAAPTGRWLGRRLALLTGACLVAGDAAVVLGGFLLAYWVRFIAPDLEATALGLDQYARLGALVSLVTVALFALHDFYDLDRPRSWFEPGQLVVSSVSTALALVVTASFFLGDQRFSRLWFAAGWAFSIGGLVGWRWCALIAYRSVRAAAVPARRVIVVGANPAGCEIARDLAGRCAVVGFVDNG